MLVRVSALSATPPAVGTRLLIEPLDYRGVTLLDGPMKRQVDEVRDWYLRIPNDDLLKGFRSRAGFPAPGVDLGGWYSSDTFHVFGQIVSGLARMHAGTGDAACRDKVNALVHEWGRCIGPDGFFYFSKEPKPFHYNYDKIVCGLVDAARYCGNSEAVSLLARITEWADKHFDRIHKYEFNSLSAMTEWYTLSENLYRAYLLTGEARYRDFAQVWEYEQYWDLFAGRRSVFGDGLPPAYHAYSHVNTLSGAAAAYLATGERRYLDVIINAYDFIQASQVYATGGYGPNECFLPKDLLLDGLLTTNNHFETQCGSWAAFKLSKYLMSFTGDARYGDWIERLAINGIGASTPTDPDGRVFYYADYNTGGGSKFLFDFHWSCCTGTRIQAVADYHDLIYFKDSDAVHVNLFAPSQARIRIRDREVTIRQETRFPESTMSELTLSLSEPTDFTVAIRSPGWLAGPVVATVNGEPVNASVDAKHWIRFHRAWKNGDRLQIELPMRFWGARFPPDNEKPYPAAILYGPVVLALRSPAGNPSAKLDFNRLDQAFVPSPGEALTWHLAAEPSVLARPFHAYKRGEPYYLYLDPEEASRWVPAGELGLLSPWKNMGLGMWASREVGSTVSHEFHGTGVRWAGRRFDDAGITEVKIDGKVIALVDQYAPSRGLPLAWETRDLPCGKHKVTLTLLPDKNRQSRDTYINLVGLAILGSNCEIVPQTRPESRPSR